MTPPKHHECTGEMENGHEVTYCHCGLRWPCPAKVLLTPLDAEADPNTTIRHRLLQIPLLVWGQQELGIIESFDFTPVRRALVREGLIAGSLDEQGDLTSCDESGALYLMSRVTRFLRDIEL